MKKNISLLSLAVLAGMFVGVNADVHTLSTYQANYDANKASAAASAATSGNATAVQTVISNSTVTVPQNSTTAIPGSTAVGVGSLKMPLDLSTLLMPTFVNLRDHLNGWSGEALKSPAALVWLGSLMDDYIKACKTGKGDLKQNKSDKQFSTTPPADVVTAMETFSTALLEIAKNIAKGTDVWVATNKWPLDKVSLDGTKRGQIFLSNTNRGSNPFTYNYIDTRSTTNTYGVDVLTTLYYLSQQVPSSTPLKNNYDTANKLTADASLVASDKKNFK